MFFFPMVLLLRQQAEISKLVFAGQETEKAKGVVPEERAIEEDFAGVVAGKQEN